MAPFSQPVVPLGEVVKTSTYFETLFVNQNNLSRRRWRINRSLFIVMMCATPKNIFPKTPLATNNAGFKYTENVVDFYNGCIWVSEEDEGKLARKMLHQ